MEDNNKDNENSKDNTDDKSILSLGLDRDLVFSPQHQRHQVHQLHDDDDDEEVNEVEDNNKDDDNIKNDNDDKSISALGLDKDCGFREEINVQFVSNCFLHCSH